MPTILLAFLIGVVTGLRCMTAPAAVTWAARWGWLPVENTALAFLGFSLTPYIFSAAAIGELINDKLPTAGSRKALGPFVTRILVGALCGAAIGSPGNIPVGAVLGALGGVAGTLGGYEFRRRLVKAIGGKDLPIALLEDAIAVGGAFWIVSQAS
jgi:uncharacterized membrane protein